MTFTLPYPPSLNEMYRIYMNRVLLSKVARAYKKDAAEIANRSGVKPILGGDVAVAINVYRPQASGDIDNFQKVVFDCLKGIAWTDDKQVKRMSAERFEDRSNPRVEVTVIALDPQLFGASK